MKLKKLQISYFIKILCYIFLFLLPWQTRWIYQWGEISGGYFEYGTLSFYGTEILLWLIVLLSIFFKPIFLRKPCLSAGRGWGEVLSKKFWKEFFKKDKTTSKKSNIFLLIYIVILILFGVILFNSLNFDISLQWFTRFLGVLCLGVVILAGTESEPNEETKQSRGIENYLLALWLGAVVQGLIALVQFFVQSIPANKWLGWAYQAGFVGGSSVIEFGGGRFLRAYGSFGSPNSLGIYLAVCLILGLILYLKVNNQKKISTSYYSLFIAGQLLILAGLILSFSRSAWLASLISLFFLFFIILKFYNLDFKFFIKQLLYYFLLSCLFLFLLWPLFTARFNLDNRLELRSVLERKSQYHESLEIIANNFWWGVGPGNYTLALHEKYPDRLSWEYQPVHNIYLLSLAELGIILSTVFYILVFWLLVKIWKCHKLFFPAVLILLIVGMFDHWLFSMYTGVILFGIVLLLAVKVESE
jgi:O-antigen ligase